MSSIIKIRKNDTAGAVPSSLQEGELAVNLRDRILYTANSSAIFELTRNTSNNGLVLTDPGGNTITIVAPTGIDANYTLTFPENDGGATQFLQTDGSGNLSWAAGSAPADAPITLTAGTGLTGGDAFTTNQSTPETITFNVGAGDGITVAADSVAVDGANGILVTTDGVNVQAADATISVAAGGIAAVPGQIDHDSLSNFVANEHVDHSTIQIFSGAGLTNGGNETITADVTHNVGQANGIIVDADSIQVNGANGILVTTAGVNVQAADATISVTSSGISVDEAQLSVPTSSITGDFIGTISAGEGIAVASGTGTDADATVSLKNAAALSDNTIAKWDNTGEQFENSLITDDGSTVTIGGNLTVNGTTTTIESTTVTVDDSLLKLANGNVTDTIDIGWYGQWDAGSGKRYGGIFRDVDDTDGPNSTSVFKVWTDLTAEPADTFNTGSGELAQLDAVIDGGIF